MLSSAVAINRLPTIYFTSTDFELDISEQTNLIIGILKYAGVIINDPTIIQTATQEAMKVEQNEKS